MRIDKLKKRLNKLNEEAVILRAEINRKTGKIELSEEEELEITTEKINAEAFRAVEAEKVRKLDEELEKELNLQYRHFRNGQSKGPIVSIGWTSGRKGNDIIEFTYTIAICSKNDFFSRKAARREINERYSIGNVISFSVIDHNHLQTVPTVKGDSEMIKGHYNSHKTDPGLFGMIMIPQPAKFIP